MAEKLAVVTLLWQPNRHSLSFSRAYDPAWVDKLYRGWARNLSEPFDFICFTDREYEFAEPVQQVRLNAAEPGYGACIEPYRLGRPMILTGLDTVITGNCDHLAGWAMTADRIALPRDPYKPAICCNGVALVPGGLGHIGTLHQGENDMEWVRLFPHAVMDDLWPGHVVSYKGAVLRTGLNDARIVYFHGKQKPHELPDVGWIARHWR